MRYRNTKTGVEFETDSKVVGQDIEEVKPASSKKSKKVVEEDVKL